MIRPLVRQLAVNPIASATVIPLLSLSLSACVGADIYSDRATLYNEETSSSKSDVVLKNILRAANNVPLQFTDISTISGTASSSFMLGSGIPVANAIASTISPSASISGGPTFSVANLNNQEFYQGLQNPLSNQLVSNLVNTGYSPYIVYPLAFSEIEINRGNQRIVWNNYGNKSSVESFRNILKVLLEKGLTFEQVEDNVVLGPSLTTSEAKNPYLLAHVATAVATQDSKVSLEKLKMDAGRSTEQTYSLIKKGSKFRPCFDPVKFEQAKKIQDDTENVVQTIKNPTASINIPFELDGKFYNIPLGNQNYCGKKNRSQSIASGEDLKINTRSVEAMFIYLGTIARNELGLVNGRPEDISIGGRGGPIVYIFKVKEGPIAGPSISTTFNGKLYSVEAGPTYTDYSSQAIQMLVDLVALQSSSKNLPAPNVITIAR
jgi:hypothetical protein